MEVWLQLLVNGISIGAVYALFALGYTLVFSVLGVINFAHGAVFTCGAYFTYIFLGGVVGSNGLLATQKLPVTFPLAIAPSASRLNSSNGGITGGNRCF